MNRQLGYKAAVLGLTLTALSLNGSSQAPANSPDRVPDRIVSPELAKRYASAKQLFNSGRYLEARETFLATASIAERAGSLHLAADCLMDAGVAALTRQDARHALPDFLRARALAKGQHDPDQLGHVLNNLAALYENSGDPRAAADTVTEALRIDTHPKNPNIRPKLMVQLASALAYLHRFDESAVTYRQAVDQFIDLGDLNTAVRVLGMFAGHAISANRLDEAEGALDEAFWIIRIHHLPESPNILRHLAVIRSRNGDLASAAVLFGKAIAAPRLSTTPRWMVYADRGEFRLAAGDPKGAFADFEEAQRFISLTRTDIVPADRDRVAMESGGLSRVPAGLVEAGNRLMRESGDVKYLERTFAAAEEDRLWSLRALAPSENDWRSRLPAKYWDLLSQYQAIEQAFLEKPSEQQRARSAALGLELQQLEAAAHPEETINRYSDHGSLLARAQEELDPDTVLLSFLVNAHGGWVWAIDRTHADVYPIPSEPVLKSRIAVYDQELKSGSAAAAIHGRSIFQDIVGSVPSDYLVHKRWLLSLDGPLYDFPFAAVEVEHDQNGPVYLIEKATLQAIPGILLRREPGQGGSAIPHGGLLAVGDAVYNVADERFVRDKAKEIDRQGKDALPRLPGTAQEIRECSRAWGPAETHVLTGANANLESVESTIAEVCPSVIHFATHVVAGPDEYASGLIALSLNHSGGMGLLGPAEIQARPVTAALVVLNGCHSDQGRTLPAAGLMGLTRAWIGSGAGAVLATRWDIADDASTALMAHFYRVLRANWQRGPAFALQHAEMELLENREIRQNPVLLGAYFLLGRV
jgi:CHAT domain-containing protein